MAFSITVLVSIFVIVTYLYISYRENKILNKVALQLSDADVEDIKSIQWIGNTDADQKAICKVAKKLIEKKSVSPEFAFLANNLDHRLCSFEDYEFVRWHMVVLLIRRKHQGVL